MNSSLIINYFISIFMLCSPLAAVPAFLNLTQGKHRDERKRIATWLGAAVGAILVIATWIGAPVLSFLGIRIPAFQCAGGIIVFLLSLSMLNAQMSPMRQTEDEEKTKSVVPIVPLAIPIMAGPGALSGVIAAASAYPSFSSLLILSSCGVAVGMVTTLILYFAMPLEKRLGPSGLNIVTRIGGLILAALAVELFAKGIKGLFPSL